MAEMVMSEWGHGQPDRIPYLERLIASGLPSICLYDQDGRIMAYEMYKVYGALGFLYVKPAYRRRGYGLLVTSLLLKHSLDTGKPMYVHVDIENDVSLQLHTKLGFQIVGKAVYLPFMPTADK
jgi:ribosomal protein S18 acetylase RimI-like enzyme